MFRNLAREHIVTSITRHAYPVYLQLIHCLWLVRSRGHKVDRCFQQRLLGLALVLLPSTVYLVTRVHLEMDVRT